MFQNARFFFASILAIAAVAGCAQSAVPPESDEEDTDSVEQPALASGYNRTYYSDSTYTTAVGFEVYDCDPDYRFLEGEETGHYKQKRYDCPEFNNPLLPACELCTTYTSGGQTFTSCTGATCPTVPW